MASRTEPGGPRRAPAAQKVDWLAVSYIGAHVPPRRLSPWPGGLGDAAEALPGRSKHPWCSSKLTREHGCTGNKLAYSNLLANTGRAGFAHCTAHKSSATAQTVVLQSLLSLSPCAREVLCKTPHSGLRAELDSQRVQRYGAAQQFA